MKKPKYPIDPKDFKQLEEMNYNVHQFSPYHYRINQGDNRDVQMDIWPTSRKYSMVDDEGRIGKSKFYNDLVAIVEEKLDIHNRLKSNSL